MGYRRTRMQRANAVATLVVRRAEANSAGFQALVSAGRCDDRRRFRQLSEVRIWPRMSLLSITESGTEPPWCAVAHPSTQPSHPCAPPRGCTVGNLFGGAQEEELKSPDSLVRGRRPTGRTGGRVSGVAPRGPRRGAVRPYRLLHSRYTSVGLVVQHRVPR